MAKIKAGKANSQSAHAKPKQEMEVLRTFQEPSYYATRVESQFGKDDVRMQFLEMVDANDQKVRLRLLASVWVAVRHYKAIYEMMGRQLAKHEEMYGPIPKADS